MSVSTKLVVGSVAIASAMLVASGAADAQVADNPTEIPEGFTAGGRLRVLYDTNILRLRETVQPPGGGDRDDLIAAVTGFASVNITPGMQQIRARAEAGRDYHSNNRFLNRTRLGADLDWDWKITPRCLGKALTFYSRAQADLADQGVIAGNTRSLFDASASGGCLIAPGFKPTLTVQHRAGDNSNRIRRASNFKTDAVEGALVYNRTGKVGVALSYRDETFTYPNRIRAVTGRTSSVQRRAVRARVDGRFANRISYAVTGDYNWVDPNSGQSRFDGFSGGVELGVRPTPRYEIRALALRSIEPALYVSAGYVLQDRLELGINYAVSPRTALSLRGGVNRNRYRDLQPVNQADVRTFDRLLFIAAGASYDVARNVRLVGEVRRDGRKTDGAFGTYRGTRAVATFSLAI